MVWVVNIVYKFWRENFNFARKYDFTILARKHDFTILAEKLI